MPDYTDPGVGSHHLPKSKGAYHPVGRSGTLQNPVAKLFSLLREGIKRDNKRKRHNKREGERKRKGTVGWNGGGGGDGSWLYLRLCS